MSNVNAAMVSLAATPMTSQAESKKTSGSWFEAMADAWGAALDRQAFTIDTLSRELEGNDTPSAITRLTTESMRMGFMSNSSHTSLSAVSEGLSTVSRKS
jgi:hypothetical protein